MTNEHDECCAWKDNQLLSYLAMLYHMAGNTSIELNLAAGKIKSVLPN